MIRRIISFGFLILALLSCNRQKDLKNDKIITVSIPPQAYFIERLAGEEYQVFVLVPPGVGPETYEPSPGDMEKVSKSVLCLFSGSLDFESRLEEKLRSWKDGPRIVDFSQKVNLIRNAEHGAEEHHNEDDHHHFHGVDPHYWLSAREMKNVTLQLTGLLTEINPANRAKYEANRDSLLKDLDKLDATLSQDFKDLKTRKFIVFHPSFSYLSRDYNLEQLSMEYGGKQPSTRQIASLVDAAKDHGIKTVFLQTQFDINNMQTLAREVSGKLETLDPLSADWLNNMYVMADKLKEAMNGK
ncbi:MAG: metal ABC transporter solute-binding protein, Zn/Mn family [Bacteroidales bacterium]